MHSLEAMMPAVNLAFFALAGASLKVTALVHSILLGSLIVTVRLMAVYIGSSVGCWASSTPPDHRRRMWQAMVTQVRAYLHLSLFSGPCCQRSCLPALVSASAHVCVRCRPARTAGLCSVCDLVPASQ